MAKYKLRNIFHENKEIIEAISIDESEDDLSDEELEEALEKCKNTKSSTKPLGSSKTRADKRHQGQMLKEQMKKAGLKVIKINKKK